MTIKRKRAQKPKTLSLGWLLASLVLTTLVAIPTAYVLVPHAKRWQMLSRLTHPDLSKRELALNYVIQFADENPRVRQAAIQRLNVRDRANFLQLVHALDQAGQWQRPTVPVGAWLRWLEILGSDPSAEARILASQLLAQQQDLSGHPQALALIQRWSRDPDPDVRYNTLATAAGLYGRAADRSVYEKLIAQAARDPQPTIARHAWLILGLIDPVSGVATNWRDQPSTVAQAVLWASLHTNPQNPQPAIQALQDPQADPTLRAMAAYALHQSDTPQAREALTRFIRHAPAAPLHSPDQAMILWRAILAVRLDAGLAKDPAGTTIVQWIKDAQKRQLISVMKRLTDVQGPHHDTASLQPLLLAAYHRLGEIDSAGLDRILETELGTMLDQPLTTLAMLEGLPVGRYRIGIPANMPDILRLAAVAAMADPTPQHLMPLFTAPRATLRDLACVVAADRFSHDKNAQLVASLLNHFNDDAKRSGAILAGLTGLHPELLAKKARHEDIWSVRQIMSLGLWMQTPRTPSAAGLPSDTPSLAATPTGARGLLTRDDLPTSTVLLAMLHQGQPAAWDFLFNPQGEEQIDLLEWFSQARWWRVLGRYLPTDAPPFWVWADPALAQFQIDLLREWYLLHRHRWPPR